MRLMRNLKDEELAELLMESDQRELQPALDALRSSLRETVERPEWFWHKQQVSIRGRIAASERAWWRPFFAWAGALALPLLALLLLRGSPAPPPIQARTDSDQELMIAVERTMQSDVPEALEPASLLADEIRSPQAAPNRVPKENKHEN